MRPASIRTRAVALVALAASAVLCAGVGTAASAQAADGATGSIIGKPSYQDGVLQVPFLATVGQGELGTSVPLATTGATVSVQPAAGAPAPKPATVVPAKSSPSETTVMLVLDNSESMGSALKGDTSGQKKFDAEKAAATQFLNGLDDGISVGLVTFGAPAVVAVRPTTDHDAIAEKIQALPLDGNTALYQALNLAADSFPDHGSRVMVVVTDGDNDLRGGGQDSKAQQAQSRAFRKQAHRLLGSGPDSAGIVFRGLIIGQQSTNDLSGIAPPGTVLVNPDAPAVAEQLKTLFDNSQTALQNLVKLTVPVDRSQLRGVLSIDVTARTTDGRLVTDNTSWQLLSGAVAVPPPALPTSTTPSSRIGTPVLFGALGALFLAMVVLIVNATGAVTKGESKESEVTRRLSFYTLSSKRGSVPVPVKDEPSTRLSDSRLARSAINLVNRIARQRKLDNALDARLEAAGLPVRTAEWTLMHLGSAVGFAVLLLIAARGMLLGALFGLLIGLAAPWVFLNLRTSMRERKFLAQLPDTLQLLAGSLAAGYSLPQAMDAVLRESEAPISVEFSRALIETRLGMPPEDALEGIATRTGSRDFSWVVMAIRIQRDVGGNLAELLSSVADTLRERERLRRQVSALSAEGKLSGLILSALPLLFALFLIFTKPDYIAPLFSQRLGIMLLATGTVLLLAGGFWMSRLVKVEV